MLANPGLSKAEGYGVRLLHEQRSLCAVSPFERGEIKEAQHLWR